jgi:hypothetical protein
MATTTTTTTIGTGWKEDFAVHASVYDKVQAGPTATLYGQERRRRKRLVPLPELGCLATHIGLCVTCVHPPMLGWYPPHHSISPQTYPLDYTPPAMQTNEWLQCAATQN